MSSAASALVVSREEDKSPSMSVNKDDETVTKQESSYSYSDIAGEKSFQSELGDKNDKVTKMMMMIKFKPMMMTMTAALS